MQPAPDASLRKVKDLSPSTKQVTLLAKVVSVGERRTVDSKFGGARTPAEAIGGGETGAGILSPWGAPIGQGRPRGGLPGDNGDVSLGRGPLPPERGKYRAL